MSKYILEMREIRKEFPGIVACDNITIGLKKGEIHALLGENGAGKSTLMSILFGLYKPDKGEILINGKNVKITGPVEANINKIGMVHQHFKLIHNFTVLENIILGVEQTKNGILDMNEARNRIKDLSDKYGLNIELNVKIKDISVSMQQKVEIIKMLYRENEILIFDEPTAVLTPQEIESLMKTMQYLAKEGKSILFITHKLDEIKQIADNCTVIRKGKFIDTVNVSTTSKEELSELMVGRKVSLDISKNEAKIGDTILDVKNLSFKNKLKNISFKVKSGEILCIAGIDGNGQTELIEAITGLIKDYNCEHIKLKNTDISKLSIRNRIEQQIGHIPEDRQKHGLVLEYDLAYNTILQTYYTKRFNKKGFLKKSDIYKFADTLIKRFDIRTSKGATTSTRSMSGGNQQKIILAREIDREPELLIAVQPTRGLDVGAIEYIHKQIIEQRDSGRAVLLVSLELEEVLNLSDRILVMYEGEIVANLNSKDTNFKELGLYMAGSKKQSVEVL
ncbi:MAG: ABC transporter ATP-binding protein [Defluviitaleaceae bacterium]|nr:ABC transporter ATP-binding protein [Defluviitaleaceae bacterium]